MDDLQRFGSEEAAGPDADDDAAIEAPPQIGTDERRMHVRAYNYWASLLRDRAYPGIEDLDPGNIEDFGPHSVLLDFTGGINDPAIAWLGPKLREECDIDGAIETVAEVPNRSLLSRLTDHYMQIIANQAPVGFEAEFVNHRGSNTMYRGILMPLSSDDDTIDFIYGVINWKEVADAETQSNLRAAVDRELAAPLAAAGSAVPVWADGPGSGAADAYRPAGEAGELPVADATFMASDEYDEASTIPFEAPETLADHLAIARASAEQVKNANQRSRAALYQTLARAYDFARNAEADREGYRELLDDAGISQQARAPMTPVVKLVFGADYDKTRLTEFAAALAHGKREDVAEGGFGTYLESYEGGLKAIVAAERAARRPAQAPDRLEKACETLREARIQDFVTLENDQGGNEEFTLLMARRIPNGRFAVIGAVPYDKTLTERAIRKLAG